MTKMTRSMAYADGGKVVKDHKLPKPQKGGKPKRIKAEAPPGGWGTPTAKGTYPKKMADGGRVKKDEKAEKPKRRKPTPAMLGTGAAAKAGRELRDTPARRLREAGVD